MAKSFCPLRRDLQHKIADGVERHFTDVEPVSPAAFPILKGRRSHRPALAVPHLLQSNLGLFTKRKAVARTSRAIGPSGAEDSPRSGQTVQVNSKERWYVVMAREEWSSYFLRCENST